jgi:hypothetical protein
MFFKVLLGELGESLGTMLLKRAISAVVDTGGLGVIGVIGLFEGELVGFLIIQGPVLRAHMLTCWLDVFILIYARV